MSYRCDAAATDSGRLIPMVEKHTKDCRWSIEDNDGRLAYCSILDLRGCEDRGIELPAPVQANSFTEKKKQAKTNRQIPRDKFCFDAERNCYQCPAGHELSYMGRERKQRHSDQSLWESRYRCEPVHRQGCPLAGAVPSTWFIESNDQTSRRTGVARMLSVPG
ncbi:MAG: hypothetical protein R3C17_17845 [Planctomycetaceae bacterium]